MPIAHGQLTKIPLQKGVRRTCLQNQEILLAIVRVYRVPRKVNSNQDEAAEINAQKSISPSLATLHSIGRSRVLSE